MVASLKSSPSANDVVSTTPKRFWGFSMFFRPRLNLSRDGQLASRIFGVRRMSVQGDASAKDNLNVYFAQ